MHPGVLQYYTQEYRSFQLVQCRRTKCKIMTCPAAMTNQMTGTRHMIPCTVTVQIIIVPTTRVQMHSVSILVMWKQWSDLIMFSQCSVFYSTKYALYIRHGYVTCMFHWNSVQCHTRQRRVFSHGREITANRFVRKLFITTEKVTCGHNVVKSLRKLKYRNLDHH